MPTRTFTVALLLLCGGAFAAPPRPPIAPREPHVRVLHGEEVTDDYHWMRELHAPRTLRHLRAEAAYAEAMMRPTRRLQDTLYREIVSRMREDDETPPFRIGDHEYVVREKKGLEYPIHARRPVGPDGAPRGPFTVFLDVNQLARGKQFFEVGSWEVSDDGNLLAYLADETGHEDWTLQVKDLRTGKLLPLRRAKVSSLAWSADGRMLFYTVEDAAKRPYRVYRHRLGAATDELIFEEKDERFVVDVDRTADRQLIVLQSVSHTQTEVRYLRAARPDDAPTLVLPREPGHEYYVEHRDGLLYLRTNRGGRNFRIVTAPLSAPGGAWKELVPHRATTMIESLDLFQGFAVVTEREAGTVQLRVIDLESGAQHRVALTGAVREAHPTMNFVFDAPRFRFRYESPTTPPTYYDYDPRARAQTMVKQELVGGGYDAGRYEVARAVVPAPDGVEIPVSVVRRKDVALDGAAPLLLEGYGAYGVVYPAGFDESIFSLLDRGVVYAIAHIRGGGELGKAWHDAGRMEHKRNSFADFVRVAEWLVERRYTRPDRLAIRGGSAGGLLMGAVLNARPDLFRVVVAHVPFVDVVNTMLDESLPLTVGEFEEWGNPKDAAQYRYLRGYCPYENVAEARYPSILVTTALNDARAPVWEAAKWVARLRACKRDERPLLLKVDLAPAGHGGPSGRYQQVRETAYAYAFILRELGVDAASAQR